MKSLPTFKHKDKIMTVAIGMICKNSILVASDSQTTKGSVKKLDAEKISVIRFAGGSTLVAQAGNGPRAKRCLEILREMCGSQVLADYRDLATKAEQAVRQLRDEMRFQRGNCNMTELDDYILKNEQNFFFLIGYYFNEQPLIFTISLIYGCADKEAGSNDCHHAAIGTGGDLADYLLAEHSAAGMEFNAAAATVIYTVEEVKKRSDGCSGKTKFAFINEKNKAAIVNQTIVDEISAGIAPFNQAFSLERNEKLMRVFSDVATKAIDKQEALEKQNTSLENPNIPPHSPALPGYPS